MIFSYLLNMQSHPSWVCGLKHEAASNQGKRADVTPFVGVWIETLLTKQHSISSVVTPFVGVWIETANCWNTEKPLQVTPFVGVWIETPLLRVISS